MRRWWRSGLLGAAVVAALAGALAGPVRAAVLVNTDFSQESAAITREGGEVGDRREGTGWRAKSGGIRTTPQGRITVDLAKAGFNPKEGTLDFVIKRAEEAPFETLFTLYDAQGETLYAMLFDWKSTGGWNQPAPAILGGGTFRTFSRADGKRWGMAWIPRVPFRVGRGGTFRLTVTWQQGKRDSLYINGRKIRTNQGSDEGLGPILAKAATMDLGVEFGGRTYSNSMRSVIKEFRLLNVATGKEIEPPAVSAVHHNARKVAGFSGKLVAGDTVGVVLKGSKGGNATFDLVHYPEVGKKLEIDWRGWGIYSGDKEAFEEGEVWLKNVSGYEVFIAQTPFDPAAPGMEPAAKLGVEEQVYTLETPEVDKPYYVSVVALMRDGSRRQVITPIVNQALTETAPGVYTGEYKVGWRDRYGRAALVGRLVADGMTVTATNDYPFAMDPSLRLAVTTDPQELKADEKSTARVDVTVTNANGTPVPDHDVKFMLFTTSQYTGIVGGGAFTEQVGGTVKEMRFGKTDLFGKVSATYVAGFAAKTAILVARDMLSNDVGSGWVKTYITATAQLELQPVTVAAEAEGYEIKLTSSDEWLTADGKSTARLTARVTLLGKPVEGRKVDFAVASGTGSIRVVKDLTDRNGEARAVYTAGKKIGLVVVTAKDVAAGISDSVQIELRSDAPAKIALKLDPQTLPADGRSRADLEVLVTDINDNPNDGVEVEYAIVEGTGELRSDRGLTDRNGQTATEYVAGETPGRVSIEITVRSTVPTPEEIVAVQDKALAVPDYRFF
ncbi:MAG TPA: hypothetical protein VI078_01805 [bacterium]